MKGMAESSAFGATSVLIMVNVALETTNQLESHMLMRHYTGFLNYPIRSPRECPERVTAENGVPALCRRAGSAELRGKHTDGG
ncbi:MAG: hypothetical protein ABFC56_09075, partial [Clostridiaceae bacterium]